MLRNETFKQLEDAGIVTNDASLSDATRAVLTALSPEEVSTLIAIKQPLETGTDAGAKGYAAQFRRYAARLQGMTFATL